MKKIETVKVLQSYHFMRYLLSLFLIIFSNLSEAQVAILKVRNLQPLNFTYSNISELSQQKIINNAIQLELKIKKKPCYVTAQLAMDQGASDYANKIYLRQASTTSASAVVSNISVPLSSAPAQLFTQPASGNMMQDYYFSYDVVIPPINGFLTPGFHTFHITFTVTQP